MTTSSMATRIIQLNINGIKNKIEDLKVLIQESKPDIVTLNETKLRHNDTIEINGYTTIQNNRITTNSRSYGGGVMTLIKDGMIYDNIKRIQIDKHEILTVDLHFGRDIVHIANCYIPPQADLKIEILELLTNIQFAWQKVITLKLVYDVIFYQRFKISHNGRH